MSSLSHKPRRLNIRVSEHEKEIISRAASSLNTSVSRFVLEKAFAEAESILADQSRFMLDKKQWQKFCKALDAPPRNISALRALLSQPGVFDE